MRRGILKLAKCQKDGEFLFVEIFADHSIKGRLDSSFECTDFV